MNEQVEALRDTIDTKTEQLKRNIARLKTLRTENPSTWRTLEGHIAAQTSELNTLNTQLVHMQRNVEK